MIEWLSLRHQSPAPAIASTHVVSTEPTSHIASHVTPHVASESTAHVVSESTTHVVAPEASPPSKVGVPLVGIVVVVATHPAHVVVLGYHLLESLEELKLVSPAVEIRVHLSHHLRGLHDIDPGGVSAHAEQFVEEVGQFVGLEGAAAIPVVAHHDLVDVLLQLHVAEETVAEHWL